MLNSNFCALPSRAEGSGATPVRTVWSRPLGASTRTGTSGTRWPRALPVQQNKLNLFIPFNYCMQDLFIYTWIRIWQACINEFIIVHSHNEGMLHQLYYKGLVFIWIVNTLKVNFQKSRKYGQKWSRTRLSINSDWHFTSSIYCQVSNIRRTLEGNQIIDHSDVVGASPVGTAPTTFSFSA